MFGEGGETIHGLLERFEVGRRGGTIVIVGVGPAAMPLDGLDALIVVV